MCPGWIRALQQECTAVIDGACVSTSFASNDRLCVGRCPACMLRHSTLHVHCTRWRHSNLLSCAAVCAGCTLQSHFSQVGLLNPSLSFSDLPAVSPFLSDASFTCRSTVEMPLLATLRWARRVDQSPRRTLAVHKLLFPNIADNVGC